MVEAEFAGIWSQVEAEKERGELAPEDEGKSEDELKGEYRKIAERRVRLGLILAEIGRRANVTVTEQELGEAMRQEALRYGAQAQQIFDLMKNNPNAQAQMRAPIFEEKVVDLILGKADVTDKPVTKDELMAEDDLPEGYGEAEPKAKAKKPAAKAKAKAATPAEETPAAEAATPRKKAATKERTERGRRGQAQAEPTGEGPSLCAVPGAGQSSAPIPNKVSMTMNDPFTTSPTSCPWWSSTSRGERRSISFREAARAGGFLNGSMASRR
jgi:hypothetical protein